MRGWPPLRRDLGCRELGRAIRWGLAAPTLVPNYNRQHHNHFHLEITPGVTWMLVQ